MSTIGFPGMPDLAVGLEITLDIALLVKSKMADICPRSNNISFWTYHFGHNERRFMIFLSHIGFAGIRLHHEILRYVRPSGVIRQYCNYRIVSKIPDGRQNIS